jgi:predicted NodU family carbamoyl transferase
MVMNKILALHTSHHGSLTYVVNNKLIFHTQLDRYNRIKNFSLPSKNILNIIKEIEFDTFVQTETSSSSIKAWNEVFQEDPVLSNKIKNCKNFIYGINNHHLFHAYCSLIWNKNHNNILVCDGAGSPINQDFERESLFVLNNNILEKKFTQFNKIGAFYEDSSKEIYNRWHQEGKLMALSLHDLKANQIQERYEKDMYSFIKKNIKEGFIFTGGCVQNVIFNQKLIKEYNVFCDPFNQDCGISLGAINFLLNSKIKINNPYLGIPQKIDLDYFNKFKIIDVSYSDIAKILLDDPVAIFQSRSEQGQRGLGNRSLLINPHKEDSYKKLNDIKNREWYRPFACSVLKEDAKEWFDMTYINESPCMMYTFDVLDNKKQLLKNGISKNFTSRIQTVSEEYNLHYYNLIKSFKDMTNIPILINTSLNLPGEVLVETMEDLIDLFNKSNLKYIYFPEIQKLIKK